MTDRPAPCAGSGQEPRLEIENDWWVGPTVQCPACLRILKPTRQNKVPRHQEPIR